MSDLQNLNDLTKVLVINDHPIVRDGCCQIFQSQNNTRVLEASSAESGLQLNKQFLPQIVILDIELPDANGFEIMPQLLRDNARTSIVIFSMHETPEHLNKALEQGARAYISKNDDTRTIQRAIERVKGGSIYLSQTVAQDLAMINVSRLNDPLRHLSEIEHQIFRRLGDGRNWQQISIELILGYKSVVGSIESIKRKLKISSNSTLVKCAVDTRN